MNEDELKNKIKFLEDKIKDLTIEIPKCLICHESVECPVTMNGYNNNSSLNATNKNFKKCKHSISNNCCYKCIKKYLNSTGNVIYTKCLANCCKVHKDSYLSYGEIGRSYDDLPEPTLWKSLGKNGVTKCRDCKKEFDTVYDLGKHIINECDFRLVKCYACEKNIQSNLIEKHNEDCFLKCKYCQIKLIPDQGNKFKPHFCLQKPMFKCKCNKLLSIYDINKNTHVECTKITNLDSILFDQDDVELNNTSQYLSANVSQPVPLSYHYSSSIFNRPVINRPVSNRPVSNIIPNLGRSYNINNNNDRFRRGFNSPIPTSNLLSMSDISNSSFDNFIYEDLLSNETDSINSNSNDNNEDT